MAMWKHLIFLFGGFQDTGIRTSYLGDLWCWDTQEYRWHQIEISDVDRKPGARSGFSFLPCAEGLILHGGYTKTYEGKRVTGMALSDTWLLKVPPIENGEINYQKFKWEKRKKIGYAPSTRSGCTMTLWSAKNMGVLFGGVSDEDKDEETLDSKFYNELFGYNMGGAGRWISLPLKKKKKAQGGGAKKRKAKVAAKVAEENTEAMEVEKGDEDGDGDGEMDDDAGEDEIKPWEVAKQAKEAVEEEDDPDDPDKTIPFARYNTMLAVQKNTLYMFVVPPAALSSPDADVSLLHSYGGILEAGSREYTLDDFFSIQLDKLDRFTVLRECIIENAEWHGTDSENESDSETDDDDSDSESASDDSDEEVKGDSAPMQGVELEELKIVISEEDQILLDTAKAAAEAEDLRKRATVFLGVSTATDRTQEDILSTPQPGETLAKFFARSKEYWAQRAFAATGGNNRGKELRRDGFQLAEEEFQKYQPLLEEIARIQAQAGLDAEELSKGGRAGLGGLGADSRNRR